MVRKIISIMLVVSHFLMFYTPLFAQHQQSGGIYSKEKTNEDSYFEDDPFANETPKAAKKSAVKNATLEGIQLLSEPSGVDGDSTISCYFIFKGNPSNYFFNTLVREKRLVFEFNDVVQGISAIESTEHLPILGYRLETEKINSNEEIAGLKPEWHDIMRFTLYFEKLPIVTVKDEYGVVSFSFKWSTDIEKQKELIVKEGNKPLAIALIGGSIVGLAALGVSLFLTQDDDVAETPDVSLDGLPSHPQK